MARSRESVRENKAMQSILRGETPEKRILVSKVDKDFQEKIKLEREIEQERINEKLEATKEARMPWFCSSCNKVMKNLMDEKMWYLYQHCFDCQIKVENKLRIDGRYEQWAKEKIKKNKISFIKDSIQKIEEFKNQSAPEFFNQVGVNYPELEKEKWDIDMKKVHKEADEALKKYEEVLEQLESE